MIRFAKIPLAVNLEALQQETTSLLQKNWPLHYNTAHYTGNWNALPLRSPGGKADTAFADEMNAGSFADTVFMKSCPEMKALLNTLCCEKMAVRLLNLQPGATIKEHRDQELAFELGEARLHIPVFTNPEVEFYLDNERLFMHPGECWYINANLPHRLANPSPYDRIHLVIDCNVNDWMQQFFRQTGTVLSELSEADIWKREKIEKLQLMESLKQMNTQTSNKMADEIEAKLKQFGLL